jgi:peptidoglycan/LPS O-acetylase OafA/YrhL
MKIIKTDIQRERRVSLEQRLATIQHRGPGFDMIRLAAAIVVLLYHSRVIEAGDLRSDPLFRFSGGFIQFGLLAVLVFFSISGFLVTPGLLRSGNVVTYLTHRALRIFPALFVVVLVSMVALGPVLTTFPLSRYFSDPAFYHYARNAATLSIRYLPGVVSHDGQPIIVNGALWTLNYELMAYLILALLGVLRLLRPSVFLGMFLIAYAAYVTVQYAPALGALTPDRLAPLTELFVYFAAGAALYVFRDRVPFSKGIALGAFVVTAATLPYGLGPILLPLCLPYVVIVGGLSVLPGASLIKHDLSYGVYLIHAPVLVAIVILCPAVKTWWMGAALAFVIAIFLSRLSWEFVEAPALRQKNKVADVVTRCIDALRDARARRRIIRLAK